MTSEFFITNTFVAEATGSGFISYNGTYRMTLQQKKEDIITEDPFADDDISIIA